MDMSFLENTMNLSKESVKHWATSAEINPEMKRNDG